MLDTSEIDFVNQPEWIQVIKKHIVQKYNPGIHRIMISQTEKA
jgi:hypothetical protein